MASRIYAFGSGAIEHGRDILIPSAAIAVRPLAHNLLADPTLDIGRPVRCSAVDRVRGPDAIIGLHRCGKCQQKPEHGKFQFGRR